MDAVTLGRDSDENWPKLTLYEYYRLRGTKYICNLMYVYGNTEKVKSEKLRQDVVRNGMCSAEPPKSS